MAAQWFAWGLKKPARVEGISIKFDGNFGYLAQLIAKFSIVQLGSKSAPRATSPDGGFPPGRSRLDQTAVVKTRADRRETFPGVPDFRRWHFIAFRPMSLSVRPGKQQDFEQQFAPRSTTKVPEKRS
jgi:hypothetical protein